MPQTFTLTAQHRETFDRTGVLRLPRFYPHDTIAPMAEALWADLEGRYPVCRREPATWAVKWPSHFQTLVRSGAFAGLASPDLRALADAFLGAGAWDPPQRWGQPLVTFPEKGEWRLPSGIWHLDYPTGPAFAAIRCFTFLEPVRPQGGGTLYVAGSHRVAMDIAAEAGTVVRSVPMRNKLKAHPWFSTLWHNRPGREASLMETGAAVRGVSVRVEEMTGEPGDLIVMHPNMLHGVSMNVLDRPRMMLVQSLMRRDATYWPAGAGEDGG